MPCSQRFGFVLGLLAVSSAGFALPLEVTSQERAVEVRGSASGDRFGRPMLFVDLDGDGFEDLVAGSDRTSFSGGERRTVHIFRGGAPFMQAGTWDMATTPSDVRLLGETGSTALATALAAGDLNNDGYQDLALADPTFPAAGRTGAGAVYIVFGGANFFGTPVRDFASGGWDVKVLGAAAGDNMGGSTIFGGGISTALAAGDIDNDGIDDLAMGAHLSDSGGSDAGQVRVIKGRTPFAPGTTIDLLTQTNYRVVGDRTFDELGLAVAIGDINRDGIDDLVMGARYMSVGSLTSEGYIQVMLGRTAFPATTDLGVTAASFSIRGLEANGFLGEVVALGDMNGDGQKDIVAMSEGWDGAGNSNVNPGAAFGFLSRTSWPATSTTTLDDFIVTGVSHADAIGNTLAVGDVNGDGIADALFTSRDGARAGFTTEGRTFVLYGRGSFNPTYALASNQIDAIINGNQSGLQLGDAIAVGDIDGDGHDEIAIAAPFLDSTTGRVYIFDLNGVTLDAPNWVLY